MREGIGVARRSRKAQGFGVSLVFFCVVGVAAVPPLSIAVHDTDVSSSPEFELCKVDLYQRGFGVAKGGFVEDFGQIHGSALGVTREELFDIAGMHSSSSGRLATLSMRAWAEKAQPDHVGKIIMVIGMLLTLLVQVGVLSFGRLPPPQIMEQQPTRYPAASVLIFTAILRLGALASITVILPFASAMSETSGHGVRDSGYLLGFYGVGALMGTVLYSFLPIQQLTLAYHAYGCITLVGNLLRGYAGCVGSFTLLMVAQVIVGWQTGAITHSILAFAYHARGAAVTPCFIFNQIVLDVGVLAGPTIASLSSYGVKALSFETGSLADLAGMLFMALFGLVFIVALFINGHLPPPPEFEAADAEEVNVGDGKSQMAQCEVVPAANSESAGAEVNSMSYLGLPLFAFQSFFLRHTQRLLVESGLIYVLEEYYKWTPEEAGFVMIPIVLYCLILEISFATVLKGTFSDKIGLLILECLQLSGCGLMLFGATYWTGSHSWCLIFGAMVIYGSNAVYGGICIAYCTKRSLPCGVASRENVAMAVVVGSCLGVCFGGIASRVVLGNYPSPVDLGWLTLGTCCIQFFATESVVELQEHRELQ